jgi:hypothetical protein
LNVRSTWLGGLLIAGLALVWFSPALIGEAFTTVPTHQTAVYPWHGVLPLNGDRYAQSDQADLNAPWESLEHRALQQGTVPLWNADSFGGQPLLANGSSGVLYPPRLVLSAFTSPTTTHTWLSLLHVMAAGLLMYLLLLDLDVGTWPAVFGAVAWMFGTYTLDWIQLEVVAPVFYLLPAGALCVRRAVAGSWRWVGAGALVVGVLFVGTHLPYAAVTAMVFLGYGAVLALVGDRETGPIDATRRLGRLVRVAAAGAVGIGLAGVTLVPTGYLLAAAHRATISYSTVVKLFLLRPADLRYALNPPPHGVGASAEIHIHQAAFVGTLVVIAALVGFFLRRCGTGLGRACVLGSVFVAIGGPVTWFAYHFVPAMQAFRPYTRLLYVTDFGTVVLGAVGLAWLLDRFGRRVAPVAAAVAIAVTALQLGLYGRGENPPFAGGHSVYPTTPLLRALQTDGTGWRILPLRYDTVHAPMLYAGQSVVFGIPSAGGYDSVVPPRTVALWDLSQGETPAAVVGLKGPLDYVPTWELATTRFNLLPRLGIDRIVSAPEVLVAPSRVLALERAGWKRTYEGRDGVVWSWTGPPVGPHVVGGVERVRGDLAALAAFTRPGFDTRSSVVLENGPASAGAGGGTVTETRGVNSLDLRVRSSGGYLVIPDMWDPGWHATVNGRTAPVVRANFNQQAVPVPPGASHVMLRYRPPGLTLGELLTLAGALVVAGLVAVPRRAPRGRRATGQAPGQVTRPEGVSSSARRAEQGVVRS